MNNMFMNHSELIIDGLKLGDKIGGPTKLAMILNESLNARNGFDKYDLTSRYLECWKNGAFDTGLTFASVFQKVLNGSSIEKAAKEVHQKVNGLTAGCGPAHRIAPLAAVKDYSINQLIEFSRKEARLTHYHPDAGNCSAVMVLLCRYLLEGNTWDETKKLISKNHCLKSTWLDIQRANLSNTGYVMDVMHAAIYFLEKEDSLKKALSFAGSANYSPVIVGIIENIRNNIKHKI